MFYELNSARVTLREYSWGMPWPLVPILLPLVAILKLLRVRVPGSCDDPNVDLLAPYRVDPADIPDSARAALRPLEEQLVGCGFIDPVYYAMFDPATMTRIYQAVFRHPAGTTIAKAHLRVWFRTKPTRQYVFPMFISAFRDGTFLVSTAGKADLLSPPSCALNRVVGVSVADLWRSHGEQLVLQGFGKTAEVSRSQRDTMDLVERHHAAVRDFHLQRGVFVEPIAVPAVPTEIAEELTTTVIAIGSQEPAILGNPSNSTNRMPGTSSGQESLIPADAMETATLAEIQRLESRKAGWGNAALTLLFTVALFFMLGIPGQKWQALLLIAAVLFVHESGHLAAMRLFGYRNLRMLFIPFFGAAAMGKNYNVPGWKKAMVSLAGPLPGIAIGIALGIAAVVSRNKTLFEASFMFLAINGFNLLPVLPLDGGWVMHALLFSRHPVLDVMFRAAAALGLLALSLGGSRLWIVGVAMLMGLPAAYRVARVARSLRLKGLDATSDDSQSVPLPVAKVIVREIRRVFPARTDAKTTAQLSLSVFESLNARPPGVLASLGFLGLHGGAFVVALVVGVALLFAQHMNRDRLMMLGAIGEPKHVLDSGPMLTWDGPEADRTADSALNTIVADFPERKEAEAAYHELVPRLPPSASARLVGQTLLVALPAEDDAARENSFNELESRSRAVRVDNEASHVIFRLVGVPPNAQAAESLAEEVSLYLDAPADMHLTPPWSPEHTISEAQLKARRTYVAISNASTGSFEDKRLQSNARRISDASRRGDQRAVQRLAEQQRQIALQIELERTNAMRSQGAEKWDLALIDLFEKRPKGPLETRDQVAGENTGSDRGAQIEQWQHDYKQWYLACGWLMGQLPLSSDIPSAKATRFSTLFGTAVSSNFMIHIGLVSFVRPADGAPALADWLKRKGCQTIKYEFYLESAEDGLMDN